MKRALERMRCSSDGSGSTRGLARWTVEGEEGKRGWREGVCLSVQTKVRQWVGGGWQAGEAARYTSSTDVESRQRLEVS